MKPHESPRIDKKSIGGDSGDSWPVWNRDNKHVAVLSLKESHQSKTGYKYMIWHIDEKLF